MFPPPPSSEALRGAGAEGYRDFLTAEDLMKRIALIAISLVCLVASPCSRSYAGYAGLIAPARKFRLVTDLRLAQRDMRGYYGSETSRESFVPFFWVLRLQYGIFRKVRFSGDLMEFDVVYNDKEKGERTRLAYSAVGLNLQGEIWRLRSNMPVEVSAGYWAVNGSASGSGSYFPAGSIKDRMLAFTLVGEMPKSPANRLYLGPLYSHIRWERYTEDLNSSAGLASHRNIGLVGGVDARLFHHIVLNLEGFWTGDYGGSGSLGWEF